MPEHLKKLGTAFLQGSLALSVMVAGTAATSAATYFVDGANPSCSNSGPGTLVVPYCTISAASTARGGPDVTLMIMPAVYREQVSVAHSGLPGQPFVFQASGAAIIDGADDFSTPGQWAPHAGSVWLAAGVIWSPKQVFVDDARLAISAVDPPASLPASSFRYVPGEGLYVNIGGDNPGTHQTFVGRRNNGFRVPTRSYVEVRDFTVRRTEDNGIYFLTGSANGVAESNSVSMAGAAGIQINATSFMTLESNTVVGSVSHGIYVLNGTSDSVLRGNSSSESWRPVGTSSGIKVETSSRIVLQGNRSYDNQDSGIQITGSDDCSTASNRAWGNGDSGYDIIGGTGSVHLGNVAYDNGTDGFAFEGTCSNQTLLNSISSSNGPTRYELVVDPTCLAGFISDYNVFWKPSGNFIRYGGMPYSSLTTFSSATGQDVHSIQMDPKFSNPLVADFQLQPISPAIDSGDSSPGSLALLDAVGHVPVDDPNTFNTGVGPITYLDRGALEYYGTCPAGPQPEVCDELDNDCDGLADDGFDVGSPCSAGEGECEQSGTVVCAPDGLSSACDATPGSPSAETCDELDNDCDGTSDNGFTVGEACSAGTGVCQAAGVTVCSGDGTSTTCNAVPWSPSAETCDGLDNDCDGTADNGFALGEACSAGTGACQAAGVTVCSGDGAGTTCNAVPGSPSAETCDGLDNDCNGTADNGFTLGEACSAGTGACQAAGVTVCSGDGAGTTCNAVPGSPSTETCDGIDNDCDGS
ncbi:MAG: right-handed parallel beta-helix repeat-containing protein, partial [Candidatus Polarisedimenticolia bacterium]